MIKTEERLNQEQGHWILAKVGKKVLRPGGLELSREMIEHLHINTNDDILEFAPGLGLSANIACSKNPNSYTGVDLNAEAAKIVKQNLQFDRAKIVVADAANTGLKDCSVSKIYGEAMLSMQGDKHKREIIKEAYRLLKPGGLYAIHELGLNPNEIDETLKKSIYKKLDNSIRVSSRPLTQKEWSTLLEEEGFEVKYVNTAPMHLLNFSRMVKDEGFFNCIKIIKNILINKKIRNRVKAMRSVFNEYEKNLNGIIIISEKK